MRLWLALCWSVCAGDRAANRHTDLDRGGSDGHELRISRTERTGTDGSPAAALLRPRLRLPRTARRSDQDLMVRWRRSLSAGEAAGARPFCVAAGMERRCVTEPRIVIDVAGRDRPESTDEDRGTDVARLKCDVSSMQYSCGSSLLHCDISVAYCACWKRSGRTCSSIMPRLRLCRTGTCLRERYGARHAFPSDGDEQPAVVKLQCANCTDDLREPTAANTVDSLTGLQPALIAIWRAEFIPFSLGARSNNHACDVPFEISGRIAFNTVTPKFHCGCCP